MSPTQVSLTLAAKSAESKFDPKRVQDAVSILADIHPDLDGKHLLFYSGDIRYARASVDTCDCPGFKAKRELVCPHRLACMIYAKAAMIDRDMEKSYHELIAQMAAISFDPFAIEHNAEVAFKAMPGKFYLGFASYSGDKTIEHQIDMCYQFGYDLEDMRRKVFDNYQLIKDKYTRPTITEAENQGYGQSPNPTRPTCHGTGVVSDWVDYGSTVVSMPSACECVCDEEDGD